MKIIVDADACPVVRLVEDIAKQYNIPVILFYDTSHIIESDYSSVVVVSKGADSADYALINKALKGDIIVTQDYGVACMALAKGCYAINQNGRVYSNDNIDYLLESRAFARKIRASSQKSHLKGPRKRTLDDDKSFSLEFKKLIEGVKND